MDFPLTRSLIEQGISDRLHLGAQLYISRNGQPLADVAFGHARPGEPMTADHLTLWLSSTKPIAAVAIAQLWERGLLDLDDRVATHIPEFAQGGKDPITLRHILTHTAGFRGSANVWTPGPWESIIARICASPIEPGWTPGQKAGYHVASSWFILGEIIRRADGRPFDEYVRDEIFLPLSLPDSWIGMPPQQFESYAQRVAPMYNTSAGQFDDAYPGNTQPANTLPRPAGNGRGPIRDLGKFYEMLLNKGRAPARSHSVLSPQYSALSSSQHSVLRTKILMRQTIEALTSRHRTAMFDETFRHIVDFGLGFIPNNNIYGIDTVPYNYGPHASPRTFGHSGSQSSTAFADPDHHLVVALLFNGMPGEQKHHARIRPILKSIYEELGLA